MSKRISMGQIMEEYLARNSDCVNVKKHPELANMSDLDLINKFEELKRQ